MSETWQFALVSEWMPNGNINEFVKRCPDANRFELVSFPFGFPPSSLLTDDYVIPVAGRRRKRFDFYAQPEDDPWGSQRGTFLRAMSTTVSNRPCQG
jgi:hypothetical protein